MVRRGELQRISRGLFNLPKMHSTRGVLPPAADDIAAAVERSIGVAVTPTGALALNALHLSTQVRAKLEFLTAGSSRTIVLRNLPIRLQHASAGRFRLQSRTVRLHRRSTPHARAGSGYRGEHRHVPFVHFRR